MLDTPLDDLAFIHKTSKPKFAKLGIRDLRDFVWLFPTRHIDYSQATKIAEADVTRDTTVIGKVTALETAQIGPPPGAARVTVSDGTGLLIATFFRQSWLVQKLRRGMTLALSGRVYEFRGRAHMDNPEYDVLPAGVAVAIENLPSPSPEPSPAGRGGAVGGVPGQFVHAGNLLPVYPSTDGLAQRTIRTVARKALDYALPLLRDALPPELSSAHALPSLTVAVEAMHFPKSADTHDAARRRLAFDELFITQLAVLQRKAAWAERGGGVPVTDSAGRIEEFLKSLEYELTDDQRRALGVILADMSQGVPMGRLLQGEVGSGKTVIALAALLATASAGRQGAFLAPTEVLAEQHFLSTTAQLKAEPVFGLPDVVREVGGYPSPRPSPSRGEGVKDRGASGVLSAQSAQSLFRPVRIALLIGSLSNSVKAAVRGLIAKGEVDIVIGTHALLEESVEFPRLALAVIDEQHRFGVGQRAALTTRRPRPHMLAMSATPIPRTLSLTVYGDLEISSLKQMPRGRRPVTTQWARSLEARSDAYELVHTEAAAGRQSFIVCPFIEPSEEVPGRSAVREYERLRLGELRDLRVGLLHGRMGLSEKQAVMDAMRSRKIDVLVATPVIEVGVDIPNATVMLIESADRFGLAQLHQLRGRVGRGSDQSTCVLLSDDPSDEARVRLATVERIGDGFELAEEDLRLRGPGDYIGTRQSGFDELKVATFLDVDLLQLARREAQDLLATDPELSQPAHALLAEGVARLIANRPAEVS